MTFQSDRSQNRLFGARPMPFRAVHEDVHSGSREAACRKCLGFRTCWLRGGGQHSVTQRFTLRRVLKYSTHCQLILCFTIDYPPPRDAPYPSVPKTGLFGNKPRHFIPTVLKIDNLCPTDDFSVGLFMKTCILGHVRLHVGSAWDSGHAGCVVAGNILSHNVLHSDGCRKYGTRCQLISCLTIDYPPPRDASYPSVPKTWHFRNEAWRFLTTVSKRGLWGIVVRAGGRRCPNFRTGLLRGGGQNSATQCFILQRVPEFWHP